MRPLATLLLLIAFTTAAHCQTYFYLGSIEVEPAAPTTADPITIHLHGDLSSTGSSITSVSHMLMGNVVHITIQAASGPGFTVLVPHTEVVEIGNLPAGQYGILVDGNFILDSAPEFQHSFTVIGSGTEDCSTLEVHTVRWATFTDTAIVVHVTNSSIGFSYPGFILFNSAGDTLAMEQVNYFAIGNESWHILHILPGADLPIGIFDAHLELWTGFYEALACTWDLSLDLCPAQECVAVHPNIQNVGGGMAIGTFSWHILDEDGEVATGQFTLTSEQQLDQAEVCLPPGNFQMYVTVDQAPTGGQLLFGVSGEGFLPGPSEFLAQIPPTLLSFALLAPCADISNGLPVVENRKDVGISTLSGGLLVRSFSGSPLGHLRIFDTKGTLVHESRASANEVWVPMNDSGVYTVQVRGEVFRTITLGL